MIPELSLIFEFEFDKELAIDWGKLSKKNVKTYGLFHILVYNQAMTFGLTKYWKNFENLSIWGV